MDHPACDHSALCKSFKVLQPPSWWAYISIDPSQKHRLDMLMTQPPAIVDLAALCQSGRVEISVNQCQFGLSGRGVSGVAMCDLWYLVVRPSPKYKVWLISISSPGLWPYSAMKLSR